MNIKKIILTTVLSFGIFAQVASAAVSGISFTTDPTSVLPGEVSSGLTVSAGEPVGEISDLVLTSSSATGEFLNSSGVEFRPTWNSNWANRTFYYRDSALGNHTLTAVLTTRAGGQSWQATQVIIVGAGGGTTDDDSDDSGADDDSDDDANNDSNNSSNSSSSHSSVESTSSVRESTKLKVDAGRSRLASVNSPVNFRALLPKSIPERGVKFVWSFGDGAATRGIASTHSYFFPGVYQVVLNAKSADEVAVSRTEVRVFKPEITLSASGNVTKIINQSKEEVNFGDWQLVAGESRFVFPSDTIIMGKSELMLPAEISNLNLAFGAPVLYYPSGEVYRNQIQ